MFCINHSFINHFSNMSDDDLSLHYHLEPEPEPEPELELELELAPNSYVNRVSGDPGFIFSTGSELRTTINSIQQSEKYEPQLNLRNYYGPMASWDVSRVKNFSKLFMGMASFNPQPGASDDISQWDTGSATTFDQMFDGCCLFNLHLSWNTSKVESMQCVFRGCTLFNNGGQPFTWDTRLVTSMHSMFSKCVSWNQTVPLVLNTQNVLYMDNMFFNCENWNQLVDFGVAASGSRCLTMKGMFSGCKRLDQRIVLRAESVCYMSDMFNGCSMLTQMPSLATTEALNNTSGMFMHCYKFNPAEPLGFTTTHVRLMTNMFFCCRELDQTVLLDTGSVYCMESMFSGCTRFNNGGVPLVLNMCNVESVRCMFEGCALFNQRLVGNENGGVVNTKSVETFVFMFFRCRSLNQPVFMTILPSARVSSMFRLCSEQAAQLPVCTLSQYMAGSMDNTPWGLSRAGQSERGKVEEVQNNFLARKGMDPSFGGPIEKQFSLLQREKMIMACARSERIGGTSLAAAMDTEYDPDRPWKTSIQRDQPLKRLRSVV